MLKEPAPLGEEAWAKLCEHYQLVLRFFKARVPAKDVEDLTQDTFVRAVQGFYSLRSLDLLKSWILMIATNVWKNHFREQKAAKRDATMVAMEEFDPDGDFLALKALEILDVPSPLDERLTEERLATVTRCIAALKPKMRQCLFLRFYQECSYREIAQILQLERESVGPLIHKAKKRLQKCCEQPLAGGGP